MLIVVIMDAVLPKNEEHYLRKSNFEAIKQRHNQIPADSE